MINSNIQSGVFIRQFEVVNADGTLSNTQDCAWNVILSIRCGMIYNTKDFIESKQEFEINSETSKLVFDTEDQDFEDFDIQPTDYFVTSYDGMDSMILFYKVVGVKIEKIVCGCQITILLEKKNPRDCKLTVLKCRQLLTPEKYV